MSDARVVKKLALERQVDQYDGTPGFFWALEHGQDERLREFVNRYGRLQAREFFFDEQHDLLYPMMLYGDKETNLKEAEGWDVIAGPFEHPGLALVVMNQVLDARYLNPPREELH